MSSVAYDLHGLLSTVFRVAGAPFAPSEHSIQEVSIEAINLGRFSWSSQPLDAAV